MWTGSQPTAMLVDLEDGITHCFVVRAFVGRQESANSNEVCTNFPVKADCDNDGITDVDEVNIFRTDPFNKDSDGDGIQDGTEIGLTLADVGEETDVNVFIPDPDPSTTTDPLEKDGDGEGFLDGDEDVNYSGAVDGDKANPNMLAIPWMILLLLK